MKKNKVIDKRENTVQIKKYWVRLTHFCNNHCVFCLDKDSQDGGVITYKDIYKDLMKGRKEKARRAILSGGDPTLHPQFIEIIKLARSLGYNEVQVITNGRMFAYKSFLNSAVQAGVSEITFSIHGHNEKLHDSQTQVKGSFRQALTGLLNALKIKGLIVNIDIVINKLNVRYLPDILIFFINLGISEFDLLQIIPFGRAWDNKKALFYDIDKVLIYLQKAFELSKNPKLHIWTNRFPPKYLEGFENLIQHPIKLYDEIGGGRRNVFDRFLKNGQMVPCRGERCSYCYLQQFCHDLIRLKKKEKLFSYDYPFCLKTLKQFSAPKAPVVYSLKHDNHDVLKFLPFYIKHRYFIKSLRCNKCKFDNSCAGMQCDYVCKNGFKALKPFDNSKLTRHCNNSEQKLPYNLLRMPPV